jgi:hypothetical protein
MYAAVFSPGTYLLVMLGTFLVIVLWAGCYALWEMMCAGVWLERAGAIPEGAEAAGRPCLLVLPVGPVRGGPGARQRVFGLVAQSWARAVVAPGVRPAPRQDGG